ncbi:hypothetical protein [Flagellimonas oceanensis]|uniref:hypothetical protein n=1 Tax=Flagellimonas oceanensis TaxID=2499163 RepID=UPI00197B11C2|nr:hypothetical protein [Allomuricauda oceanensis]|tara:strand:+ start:16900 stop:17061 length:162 start_codon:yes stop_codon:yes gene_type:complete
MAAILAFAGSNSSTSINYKLMAYINSLVQRFDIQVSNRINPFLLRAEGPSKAK